MDTFADWIGRTVTRHDVVTARLLAEYRATIVPFLFDEGDRRMAPPGFHWGLAPAILEASGLGPDGAEERGLFIPPIELELRMWAGGRVETFAPIVEGAAVTRRSTLSEVKLREGRSGPLYLVSILHEIESGGELAVRERQDLLFRNGARAGSPQPAEAGNCDLDWAVEGSPTLLFRFSAFTFNGHRIHYDESYARDVEGYPGLLVHGPLQATLLLNQAAAVLGRVPQTFDYRCVAPLIAGQVFHVQSRTNNSEAAGRIVDASGVVTCEASAA